MGYSTCVLDETDALKCWGALLPYLPPEGTGPDVLAFSAGGCATCVVTTSHDVECFSPVDAIHTDMPPNLGNVVDVEAKDFHVCTRNDAGEMHCWGLSNGYGNEVVPGGIGFVEDMAVGNGGTCAITSDGIVHCWGYSDLSASIPAVSGAHGVTVGQFHACVLDDQQTIRCWGRDDNGEVSGPTGIGSILKVVAESNHTCALTLTGHIQCWGEVREVTTEFPTGGGFVDISVGRNSGCAVDAIGAMTCWGANISGEATVHQ